VFTADFLKSIPGSDRACRHFPSGVLLSSGHYLSFKVTLAAAAGMASLLGTRADAGSLKLGFAK